MSMNMNSTELNASGVQALIYRLNEGCPDMRAFEATGLITSDKNAGDVFSLSFKNKQDLSKLMDQILGRGLLCPEDYNDLAGCVLSIRRQRAINNTLPQFVYTL